MIKELVKKVFGRASVKTTNVVGTFTNEDFPGMYPFGSSNSSAVDTNTVILACTAWAGRTFPEARFRVVRDQIDENGVEAEVEDPNHALAKLIQRPNPHHSRSIFWQATLPCLMVKGNAYWRVLRGADKTPSQLWWIPPTDCWPVRNRGSNNFIDFYKVRNAYGDIEDVDPRLIIHLRDGIDPSNTMLGYSKLAALLREVLTDNEAAVYMQHVLENVGVTGGILAPKTKDNMIDEDEAKVIARLYQASTTGRNRGKIAVLTGPVEFASAGKSPRDLVIDKVRTIPEERISAVFGIPAIVAGLGAGLSRSTMANFKEAREQAYESMIVPTQCSIAEQLDIQALPLFKQTFSERRCSFDNTKVRVFQEDENDRHDRIRSNWEAGLYTLGQCGELLGFQVEPAEEKLRVFDFKSGLQTTEQAKAKQKMIERRRVTEIEEDADLT